MREDARTKGARYLVEHRLTVLRVDKDRESRNTGPLCAQCGASLTRHRRDARYCSDACKQAAYRRRHAPALDSECVERPGDECRWEPSCARHGCWRVECEQSGRPLFGVGPSARGAA